jgi:hypothetical protein
VALGGGVPEALAVLLPVPVLVALPVPVPVALRVALDEGVAAGHGSATPPGAANDAGTVHWLHWFQPQHVTAPLTDSAHVWASPADTAIWPPAATAAGTVL